MIAPESWPKGARSVETLSRPAPPVGDSDRVIRFVRDFRAEHGVGPTWSEVAAALDWGWVRLDWSLKGTEELASAIRVRREGQNLLAKLLKRGWLVGAGVERGLDLGERSRAWLAEIGE